MSLYHIRFAVAGGHVHCRLFCAKHPNQTYAKCGESTVRRGEEMHALLASFAVAEFIGKDDNAGLLHDGGRVMYYKTVRVPVGEECGLIDWEHETARDLPTIWHEADAAPEDFLYNGRTILRICMWDGWPYWKPYPAVAFIGPLNSMEWHHFGSYGMYPDSITKRKEAA